MAFLGYALLILATIGRIWCAIYIAGRKNKEVCRSGPYSLCRNPLYLFSFLGLLGVALGAQNLPLALAVTPIYWIYYAFVIRGEEGELRALFGEAFEVYRREVPAVLPRWRRPEAEDISPRDAKILFRAVLDAQVFLWLLLLLEILEYARPHFRTPWILPF